MARKKSDIRILDIEDPRTRRMINTLVVVLGLSLISVKFFLYRFSGATAILADALVTAFIVTMIGLSLTKQVLFPEALDDLDSKQQNKIDYLAAGFGGPVLIGCACWVLKDSFNQIASPKPVKEINLIVLILVCVFAAIWIMGRIIISIGNRTHSHEIISDGNQVIKGNYPSGIIIIGLVLISMTGAHRMDGVVSAVVGIHFLAKGFQVILLPFKDFRDTSEPDFLHAILRFFNDYRKDIWIDVHQLRAWEKRNLIHINFHLILPRDMSLDEAHKEPEVIARLVDQRFRRKLNVQIHIEPCIDSDCRFCMRENCQLRKMEPPKKETTWTIASMTSANGPSNRAAGEKEWTAPSKLMSQAISIVENEPELLEWLFEILAIKDLRHDVILARMEAVEPELRRQVLAEELLKQQHPGLRKMLASMMVFNLPVPKSAISAICYRITGLDEHLDRATELGLLEISRQAAHKVYQIPEILIPFLEDEVPDDKENLERAATLALHHVWAYEEDVATEEQLFEIHRLAISSRETRIAVEISDRLARLWYNRGQFQQSKILCEKMLKLDKDDYRLLRDLAQAEKKLGQLDQALDHYQQSLLNCPDAEQKDMASILHNLAVIYFQKKNSQKALTLFERSLKIKESINHIEGKAASMSWIAKIYVEQENLDEALLLYQKALDLQESLGDHVGKANTLHEMAGVYMKKMDLDNAMALYEKALAIREETGNMVGKGATLNRMAAIHAQRGDLKEALMLYQQLLDIKTRIGDQKGKTETLAIMSKLSVSLFQQLKTPDLEKVRKIMAKR